MTNATFLVDISALNDPKDIRCDHLGSFKNNFCTTLNNIYDPADYTFNTTLARNSNCAAKTLYFVHRHYSDFKRLVQLYIDNLHVPKYAIDNVQF